MMIRIFAGVLAVLTLGAWFLQVSGNSYSMPGTIELLCASSVVLSGLGLGMWAVQVMGTKGSGLFPFFAWMLPGAFALSCLLVRFDTVDGVLDTEGALIRVVIGMLPMAYVMGLALFALGALQPREAARA